MKKYLLASALSLCTLNSYAKPQPIMTCLPEYQGKQFALAYIASGLGQYGLAQCEYQNKGDTKTIVYKYPRNEEYMRISGNWVSAMPGDTWCATRNGGTAETCKFALRDILPDTTQEEKHDDRFILLDDTKRP